MYLDGLNPIDFHNNLEFEVIYSSCIRGITYTSSLKGVCRGKDMGLQCSQPCYVQSMRIS